MAFDIRTLSQNEYPPSLLQIPGVPKQLWIRGKLPSPETKLLAVVGSRALSPYGKEACEKLIMGLAGYPISIVSGLALGGDACGHRAALQAGLHTIAIPGSGLDDSVISPRSHIGLAKEILLAGGALLSEHEAKYLAHPYDFPSRNRIVAGMSDAILMIEAGAKSGTLITARLSSEYNKELLCIPHRIGDSHGFGAHLFTRLGATLVSEPEHILEALHIKPIEKSDEQIIEVLDGAEQTIYKLLAEPMPRDELIRAAGIDIGEALTALVTLELKGLAREEFGSWRRT